MNLHNLINEAENKLEELSQDCFIEYFEKDFLLKIKKIRNQLYTKCYEQADSLKEAEFKNEFKKII